MTPNDHPLRLARLRAGLGGKALSDAASVSRSTVQAIEEGRTRNITPQTLEALAQAVRKAPRELEAEIYGWHARREARMPDLSPSALALLQMPPHSLKAITPTFRAWRERIADTPNAFAAMLGLNMAVVSRYEHGIRVNGMPDTLSSALMLRLGINDEYLLALQALEPS